MEKQNKVGFVIEEELNKKALLTEVESNNSFCANRMEEEGLGSIQKEKSQKQNNEGLLTKAISANRIEEEEEEEEEEEGHWGFQKGKSENQNNNNNNNNNLGGGVLIEGLNKKGTNGIIDNAGGDQSAQQGEILIKSPNSLYLLKRVPSFPGRKEIVPLLYMPPCQSEKEKDKNKDLNPNNHTLLDLSKKQVPRSRIYLPELKPGGSRICGFSKQWMAVTEGIHIHLLNPFSRALIRLPNRSEIPVIPQHERFTINYYNGPYYVLKVAVLDSSGNMVVGALDASGMIFFTGKNDDHWRISNMGFFEDIITWQEDRFLGLKGNGDIILFNIGTAMLFSHVELPNWPPGCTSKSYLAECSDGGLLVIARMILKKYDKKQKASFYTTKTFQVFKLQGSEWVRQYKLPNILIFLGVSESRVYDVHHGNSHGYNRIYFSDDNVHRYYFHEEDTFILKDSGHFTLGKSDPDHFTYSPYSPPSPPLWVGGPAS